MAAIDQAREAIRQKRWAEAYARFGDADVVDPEDLEWFAIAAFLIGKDTESADTWARAHHAYLESGDVPQAALAACRLAFGLINTGQMAQAGGWIGTAARVLGDHPECPAHGFLQGFEAVPIMFAGDPATALPLFVRAGEIADRHSSVDGSTMARLGQGQCSIMLGDVASGVSLLDEAMVACTSGATTPILTGMVYCAVIDTCTGIFDVRRMREWTAALTRWCDAQPDLVPYRGQCLVHRAQVLQQRGAWTDALDEASYAVVRLSEGPQSHAVGMALYELAEMHRLLGDFSAAEENYRRANDVGRLPQPGLALLRLAQGQADAAATAIERALDDPTLETPRLMLLGACVEILLAVGNLAAARERADELAGAADATDMPYVRAMSAHATGAVLLAGGDPRGASTVLKQAFATWRELDLPYEGARTRVLIADAGRALGDTDAAEMELDAARRVFEELGAKPDLDRLSGDPGTPGGLTSREVQVLRLVATGKTNRAVASELVLSEKTVARHVANIFTKLGVSSRAAATAYAYEHDLV